MEKKYTLPAPFAKKWVAELRSGKYEQTKETLHDENGYCCLGVACRMVSPKSRLSGGVIIAGDVSKALVDKIPQQLRGNAQDNELVGELTKMNDRKGYDFYQIASWLEANVHFEPVNLTAKDTQAKIEKAFNERGDGSI